MSFESALPDTRQDSELKKSSNLRLRAQLSEWMDEPCSHSDLRECLHHLAQVNRITLAYRPTLSYFGFKTMAMAARWHHFVRQDGPVSIRRAFLPSEWKRYAEASGLSSGSVHIDIRWPARFYVARMKKP
jgi:hypothetical protein